MLPRITELFHTVRVPGGDSADAIIQQYHYCEYGKASNDQILRVLRSYPR